MLNKTHLANWLTAKQKSDKTDYIKIKDIYAQKALLTDWKHNLQRRVKYMQIIYLIRINVP